MSAINAPAAFRALLLATPEVAAVTTNVYVGAVDGGQEKFPAVLIQGAAGGRSWPRINTVTARFNVRCYGDTQPVANALYEALRGGLHARKHLTAGGYRFRSIFEETAGQHLREPVGSDHSHVWNAILSVWNVTICKS